MIVKDSLNTLLVSMRDLSDRYTHSEQQLVRYNLDYCKVSEFVIQVDIYQYLNHRN